MKENTDGRHAEFLTRRQELEYQRTLCDLWVMYGRVTESAQENQPTQDLELLMQIMNCRLQSLAKLNSDFDYQGTTEESSITQNSQLSSRRLARNSACPPSVFSFTQSRTAATRRANLRKIHLHLEYRRI